MSREHAPARVGAGTWAAAAAAAAAAAPVVDVDGGGGVLELLGEEEGHVDEEEHPADQRVLRRPRQLAMKLVSKNSSLRGEGNGRKENSALRDSWRGGGDKTRIIIQPLGGKLKRVRENFHCCGEGVGWGGWGGGGG